MDDTSPDFTSATVAKQRLGELLEDLSRQGLTQQKAASQAALPAQYLSDIKHGRRPMTELVARRLGEQFGVNHEWLLGANTAKEPPRARTNLATLPGSPVWLPLFSELIDGEPRAVSNWDGAGVEIAGAAAGKLVVATQPYVLRLGHDDVLGRLHRSDLILISQAPFDEAEISIVKHRNKLYLTRQKRDGWERVDKGTVLPAACTVQGHCVGVVWSSLC